MGDSIRTLLLAELVHPEALIVDDQIYNVLGTGRDFIIIFFLVIPIINGGTWNLLVPLLLGAPNQALPRTNHKDNGTLYIILGA